MGLSVTIRLWLILLASAAGCAGHPSDESRASLAAALKENLGDAADPHVGFRKDSAHLLVQLSTAAFPTVSESTLTLQAKTIGRFALSHYENSEFVDSVTVRYREKAPAPGIWYIRHDRTFAVESLRRVR